MVWQSHRAMKSRRPPPQKVLSASEQQSIDALYGLEPVFEPQSDPGSTHEVQASGGTRFCVVQCPYCGENFETLVDLSAGSSTYIEDCQVCCQPIEFAAQTDLNNELTSLTTRRSD